MKPAVFIDKDGTLIEDVPFNVDPAQVRLAPGVVEELVDLLDQSTRIHCCPSKTQGTTFDVLIHDFLDALPGLSDGN